MESKPLKQQVALVVDTMGMKGLVERRVAAEQVYHESPEDYWSVHDEREAKIQAIQREVTTYMNGPLPDEVIEKILPNVPAELCAAVEKLPRYICVSERGGRGSQHVMSWRAKRDDWDKNYELKAYVTHRASLSRDDSRGFRDLLDMRGVQSLADLFSLETTS